MANASEKSIEGENAKTLLEDSLYDFTSTIDPEHFFSILRQERHLTEEEAEEIRNPHVNKTRPMRARALLDTLLRRGPVAIERFFHYLQFEYPSLYECITGKKAESPPKGYSRKSCSEAIMHLPDLATALLEQYKVKKDLTFAIHDLQEKLQVAQKVRLDLELEVARLTSCAEENKKLHNQTEIYKSQLSSVIGENEINKTKYLHCVEESNLRFQSHHKLLEENNHLLHQNQNLQYELNELRREKKTEQGATPSAPSPPCQDVRPEFTEACKDILQDDLNELKEAFQTLQEAHVDLFHKYEKAARNERLLNNENQQLQEKVHEKVECIRQLKAELEHADSRLDDYFSQIRNHVEDYVKLEKEKTEQLTELKVEKMQLQEENHKLEMRIMRRIETEKRNSIQLLTQFRDRSPAISVGSPCPNSLERDFRPFDGTHEEVKNFDEEKRIRQDSFDEEEPEEKKFPGHSYPSTKVQPPSIKRNQPEQDKKPLASLIDELNLPSDIIYRHQESKEGYSNGTSSLEKESVSETDVDSLTSTDEQQSHTSESTEECPCSAEIATNKSFKYPTLSRNFSVPELDVNIDVTVAVELLETVRYDKQKIFQESPISIPTGGKFCIEIEGGNITGIFVSKSEGVQGLAVGSQLIRATCFMGNFRKEFNFLCRTLEEATLLLDACRHKDVSDLKLYVMKPSGIEEKRKCNPGDYIFVKCNVNWDGRVGNKACQRLEPWRIFLVNKTRYDSNLWEAKQIDRRTGRSSHVNQIPSLNYLKNVFTKRGSTGQPWTRMGIKKTPSTDKLRTFRVDPYVKVLPVRSNKKFPVILLGKNCIVKAISKLLESYKTKYILRRYECKSTESRWMEWVREDVHIFFEGSSDIIDKCQGRAIYLKIAAADVQDLVRKLSLYEQISASDDSEKDLVPDFYAECVNVTDCVDGESVEKLLTEHIDNAQSRLFWFTQEQISKRMVTEYEAYVGASSMTEN